MATRRIICTLLVLVVAVVFLAHGPAARADAADTAAPRAPTVPLDQRAWDKAPTAAPAPLPAGTFVRTGLRAPCRTDASAPSNVAGSAVDERSVIHAAERSPNRFRVTTVRLWLYRDFLPKSDDSDVLGIEVDSEWGAGCLDFSNITYIELADYARAVPGRPYGNPVPGLGAATGVTDLLTALLVSPKKAHHGPHHFALGFAAQLPTASDSTLGSGKWAAGPAVEYEYENGRFYAAFVALQLWSFAGDEDRKNVNMLMVKPMITYEFASRWKAVYMPYGISVYWEKPRGQRAYVPLGGGIQHEFCIGSQKMAASLQFFKYVVRPSKGSEYDLRFMLEFDF